MHEATFKPRPRLNRGDPGAVKLYESVVSELQMRKIDWMPHPLGQLCGLALQLVDVESPMVIAKDVLETLDKRTAAEVEQVPG